MLEPVTIIDLGGGDKVHLVTLIQDKFKAVQFCDRDWSKQQVYDLLGDKVKFEFTQPLLKICAKITLGSVELVAFDGDWIVLGKDDAVQVFSDKDFGEQFAFIRQSNTL